MIVNEAKYPVFELIIQTYTMISSLSVKVQCKPGDNNGHSGNNKFTYLFEHTNSNIIY